MTASFGTRNDAEMKKITLVLLAAAFLFPAAKVIAAAGDPALRLSDAYWDFGSAREGVVLKKKLVISNAGTGALVVRLRSSCECVTPRVLEFNLAAGGSKGVPLRFDTHGYSGKKTEYVFIDTNDPENKHITWLIEGEIVPAGGHARESGAGAPAAGQHTAAQPAGKPAIRLALFHTPGCRFCEKLKNRIIPGLGEKYGVAVEVEDYPLTRRENYERLLALESGLGGEVKKLPAVFAGGVMLGGEREISRRLEAEVARLAKGGAAATGTVTNAIPAPAGAEMAGAPQNSGKAVLRSRAGTLTPEFIRNKINALGLIPVAFAGFLDGLNPCAFAAIVFLIAYLTMVQRKPRHEVFWTGVTFVLGTFATYFLIGMGLAKAAAALNASALSRIVYGIAGLLTLALSYWSFSDYFAVKKIEKGGEAKVVLQLPNYFRWKIYGVVEKYGKLKYLAPFGFLLGAAVTVLEFFCTGQIYLPAIMYMASMDGFRTKALFYLAVYCLAFVLPLIVVFGAMLAGAGSDTIENAGRKRISAVKLASAILFLALAVVMFSVALF
jgi:glutaredoxin